MVRKIFKMWFVVSFLMSTLAYAKGIEIKTITGDDAGFYVNSHLIVGEEGAILVDAQFTNSNAAKVVELIKETKKDLLAVVITHAHPDHYFGLEKIRESFPKTPVYSDKSVIEEIEKTADGKLKFWTEYYKDEMPKKIIKPKLFPQSWENLKLSGREIQVQKFFEGESESSLIVRIPSVQALITGDIIYNNVHLWLAERRGEKWLKNIKVLSQYLSVKTIYPGHGPAGGKELFEENTKYIQNFLKVVGEEKDPKVAAKLIKEAYKSYKRPDIVDYSVAAYLK